MGLTIHYTLRLNQDVTSAPIHELACRAQEYARKIGCAEVSELIRADEQCEEAPLFFRIGKTKDRNFGLVKPWRGWLVNIWPGAGCETATLGLCQYPEKIVCEGNMVATGFKGGWSFQGFCKTQYAGEHGVEHFLKCHLIVVSLLDFWRGMGVRVKVNDEGGYWKSRSIDKLREELRKYDRLIAAAGGVFKDVENGLAVRSPIFNYQNFERLEHEGRQEFGGRLEQFQAQLKRPV
jgi:hypothetical protein